MKKLIKIFVLSFLLFEFVVSQCLGDFNLNYQVEQTDLNIFSNYLLLSNDTIINNADIDYNNSLDIFDLLLIADEIIYNGIGWCEFENVDLSNEWEEQEDTSYYDHENLQTIINNNINNLPHIRGLIVIHRGKVVGEKYYNNSE